MQASTIISNDMTLEQKLEAIDKKIAEINVENILRHVRGEAPIDPMDLLQCEGCQ